MKPDIYFHFATEGIHLLPLIEFDWGSGWHHLRINIGWLFWFVDIEWPIE